MNKDIKVKELIAAGRSGTLTEFCKTHGATWNDFFKEDDYRNTALLRAATDGYIDQVLEVAQSLGQKLTHYNVAEKHYSGRTFLQWATMFGHLNQIKKAAQVFDLELTPTDFIKEGKPANESEKNHSALYYAAQKEQLDQVLEIPLNPDSRRPHINPFKERAPISHVTFLHHAAEKEQLPVALKIAKKFHLKPTAADFLAEASYGRHEKSRQSVLFRAAGKFSPFWHVLKFSRAFNFGFTAQNFPSALLRKAAFTRFSNLACIFLMIPEEEQREILFKRLTKGMRKKLRCKVVTRDGTTKILMGKKAFNVIGKALLKERIHLGRIPYICDQHEVTAFTGDVQLPNKRIRESFLKSQG